MRKGLLTILLAANLPLATAAAQEAAPAGARQVALELRENGQIVAASNVRLQLGRPAAISVRGPYTLRLRVDAAEGQGGYTVRPNLHADGPGGWTRLETQPILVAHGARTLARVARPSGPPLELAVSVD